MQNAGQDEAQARIKIVRRNINYIRYSEHRNLIEESKEKLKCFSMKMKEESEKVGLKFNTQKTKILASSPVTSWQIDGEAMETVRDFTLRTPKSLEMETAAMKLRLLLLGRKMMTKLDSVLKSRDITLPTKVCLVKAMVFPVIIYGCESWTIKTAEHGRIDAFEL